MKLGTLTFVMVLLAAVWVPSAWAVHTCSTSHGCGAACNASGNVSATCSSTASGVTCTLVTQDGDTTTTITVTQRCPKEKLSE